VLNRSHADLLHFQIYDERLFDLFLPRLIHQGVPRVISIQTEFSAEQVKANKYRPLDFLPRFSAIICGCNATKLNLVSLGIKPETCHVIYNGVDLEAFTRNQVSGEFITWIGRVDQQDKNPMLFVRIAELAQQRNLPYRFRMVGTGPLLPAIEDYLAKKRIRNLQLYGWAKDIRQMYREARVLCMTSFSEAMPFVITEAMACGVPVVATQVGGISELIKDDSVGFLISGFTEPEFLEAISTLCEDAGRHAAVCRNARERVEQAFSLDNMLAKTADLYAALLRS
jgi:glycosyltransferase involved in cell wall biosynthesis